MTLCFFFLMIFAYYLTVRMEFFEYIEGDFHNYDEYAREEDTLVIEMADISYRNQLMETSPKTGYVHQQQQQARTDYDSRYQTNDKRYEGQYDPSDPRYQRIQEEYSTRSPPPPE